MTDPRDSRIHDPVHRALDLLSARAWPGSNRNHAIEEFIMSGSRRFQFSRRGVWLGGALLLLCGSAVGAVVTSVVTQRFTATVVGSDGVTYEIEGVLQVEDEGSGVWMTDSTGSIPEGEYPKSGTLTLEDGSTVTLGSEEENAGAGKSEPE